MGGSPTRQGDSQGVLDSGLKGMHLPLLLKEGDSKENLLLRVDFSKREQQEITAHSSATGFGAWPL